MKGRQSFLVLTIISLFIATACSNNTNVDGALQEKETRTVQVTEVQSQMLDSTYVLSGTLQPYEQATVSFQASGEVKETVAQVGAIVRQGDVLAALDYEHLQLQVEQAKIGVMQAQGQLEAANAAVATADAQVSAAEANLRSVKKGATEQQIAQAKNGVSQAELAYNKAKSDAERYTQLYEQGALSLSDYENVQLQYKNAEIALDNARKALTQVLDGATDEQLQATEATVQQAQAGKKTAVASVTQANAGYANAVTVQEQAELALSKAKLIAPISGVVLDKFVAIGQLTGSSAPAYTIGNIDQLKVLLPVPDRQAASWQAGQEVILELHGETRTATVSNIYPQTNAGTGTVSVEVLVPNEKHDWMSGQVVKAKSQGTETSVILVPVQAVISFGDVPYVFRVVDGVAVKTTVELAAEITNNYFQVVNGLNDGDVVVISGADKLFDGDPLQLAGEKAI